ncbi:MAG: NAD(P)/FAD-dependent oxidoreductase [Hydrococcus sp. Prado102]|jgi:flavin-dependent dehydrogenase|nr:NAD(P)/FAD-dependent oxidoreductase [Hydrococcus sp. Prado102]
MQNFDVVVVGTGPAGGQCARILAKKGWKVLLVEQHETFLANNFSSAASPIEILSDYDIPSHCVGSYWNNLAILSTNVSRHWESSESLGVVFDFAKLREYLAAQVKDNGSEVWMGCRYFKHYQQGDRTTVFLQLKKQNETISVSTKILVDATGFARAVMYPSKKERPSFLKGTGIEYLLRVDGETYQKYSQTLVFFLGYYWSPQGYSWIFPMDDNQLKVGSAIYNEPHKILKKIAPLKDYTKQIIEIYIQPKNYEVLDIHGSIIEYSKELDDRYYQNNLIAIGDTVSTVNSLGGEGIRHGFRGAEIACQSINAYLKNEIDSFASYQKQMKEVFERDWKQCDRIRKKVYLEYSDRKIDLGVAYLKYLSINDLIDILFYYKFDKFSKGLLKYIYLKLELFLKKISQIVTHKKK